MAITSWERLIAAATLGTSRAPVDPQTLWPDPAIAHETETSERTLLRAAAASYLWTRAGVRGAPSKQMRGSAPAPPSQALVDEVAAWRLGRMIGGDHRDLIPEWLNAAAREQLTVPPHWLPVLLDALSPELRARYSTVLGPAGEWLAALEPRWAFVTVDVAPSEERWQTGSLEQRVAELRRLRSMEPARAREWLQQTWSSDPPEAREAFLEALRIGLSSDDEPLLELALDDRRKGVRTQAVENLARLSGSAHAQRTTDRLRTLLVLEPKKSSLLGGLRRRRLEVRLPDAPDKAAQRDGIELKPPAHRKTGERVFWLTQMIAMTNPVHWNERFDCDAATFIEAAAATDFGMELLGALTAAVVRHPDSDWIEALSDAWLSSKAEPGAMVQPLNALLASASEEQRSSLPEALLRTAGVKRFDLSLHLLRTLEQQWTPAVTCLALEQLRAVSHAERAQWSHPRNSLDSWAHRCDVDTALGALPQLLESCPPDSQWRNALEQMNDTVEFRAAMLKELRRAG